METKYYSEDQLLFVAGQFDLAEEELEEIIKMDFIDERQELPSVEQLISHIEYQESIAEMCRHYDNEHDFGIAWSEKYA